MRLIVIHAGIPVTEGTRALRLRVGGGLTARVAGQRAGLRQALRDAMRDAVLVAMAAALRELVAS